MSRLGWLVLGLVLGASLTAHAATDLDRSADRAVKALERIAQALERGR